MLMALMRDSWTKRIFLVPTSVNPLKEIAARSPAFGKAQVRLDWIRTWLDEVKAQSPFHLFQKISLELQEFVQSNTPTYTIDTFTTLSLEHVDAPWVLCVGGDSVATLDRWKSIGDLLDKLHSVWIFPRGSQTEPAQAIPAHLRPLCEFRVMADRVQDVSSTKIREALLAENVAELLPRLALLPQIAESLRALAGA